MAVRVSQLSYWAPRATTSQCAASYLGWLKSRLTFFSGVQYAEERLCDGTRTGVLVGLSIGGVHLVLAGLLLRQLVWVRERSPATPRDPPHHARPSKRHALSFMMRRVARRACAVCGPPAALLPVHA